MNRLVPLTTVLLLVVAGCTGAPTDPGSNATSTLTETTSPPTDTISETTQTSVSVDESFAPGVNATSVANVSALLEAHTATLRDRGFRLVVNRTRTGDDGPVFTVEQQTVAEAGLRQYRRATVGQVDGEHHESNQWANATLIMSRTSNETTTSYDNHALPEWSTDSQDWRAHGVTQTRDLQALLEGGTYTLTGVTQADGERLATYVATNITTADSRAQYGDRRVELVVSDSGYIRSVNASGTLAASDATFTYGYRVAILGVEDVSTPAWVAAAPTPVNAEVRLGFEGCNGTVLTLNHKKGDIVPAGTTVRVTAGDETYQATLDTQLHEGESRYLALVDGNLQIVSKKPAAATVDVFPHEVSYAITTESGLRLSSGGMSFNCVTADSNTTTTQQGG